MGVALEILKLLEKLPRQSPQSMARALPYGVSSIKVSLVTLLDLGHVNRVVHGLYEITESGKRVLHQQLNVKEAET